MESYFELYQPAAWFRPGTGTRYRQFSRHIRAAIDDGRLQADDQLPPERDLAQIAQVSRATVRKAVAELVKVGLVAQRRGAGTFVSGAGLRTTQSLSSLVSFSDNIRRRGKSPKSAVLKSGLFAPNTDEVIALGLSLNQRVARVHRLRSADQVPMAIEKSSLPSNILPNPELVGDSLYAVLRQVGQAPIRAIQRVSAVNVIGEEATLLGLAENTAILRIDRTAFLSSGRAIEFTRGLYRPENYDFMVELRPDDSAFEYAYEV